MELAVRRLENQAADHAAHNRAADAQRGREPESKLFGPRHDLGGDPANDEADNDGSDDAEDAHGSPPEMMTRVWSECGPPTDGSRKWPSAQRRRAPPRSPFTSTIGTDWGGATASVTQHSRRGNMKR